MNPTILTELAADYELGATVGTEYRGGTDERRGVAPPGRHVMSCGARPRVASFVAREVDHAPGAVGHNLQLRHGAEELRGLC